MADVGHEFVLALREHLYEHADELGRIVVEEDNFVLDLGEHLNAAALHGLEFVDVMHVWVRQLVSFALLNVPKALASLVEPQVEEIARHNLQLLERIPRRFLSSLDQCLFLAFLFLCLLCGRLICDSLFGAAA